MRTSLELDAAGEGLSSETQQEINFYEEDLEHLHEKAEVVNAWVDTVDV